MDFEIEPNQIVYRENGRALAWIHWTAVDAQTIAADHTFVDESLRGGGVGKALLDALAAHAAARGWRIRAVCPFVVKWFERSGEYDGVKAE